MELQHANPANARPEETWVDYRVRMHRANHDLAESKRITKKRRGRISDVEKSLGYEYVIWARPRPDDRRRLGDLCLLQWKVLDAPPPAPYPDARLTRWHGYVATPFEGIRVLKQVTREARKNREYVGHYRAKSRHRAR